MDIPREFQIYGTEHWLTNHRVDSALPGYPMISPTGPTSNFSDLSMDTLESLGSILATTEDTLRRILNPKRVYIGRYGHTPGLPVRFHLIPICDWLEELFWKDERYRALQAFGDTSDRSETDGADLTFFVWQEFCENPRLRRSRDRRSKRP